MKYLLQFLIIIGFSFAGELLNRLLPLPVPASIYGIILLFIALEMKWIKVDSIKEVSSFLIAIMPIMFLPPAVGLLGAWDDVRDAWPLYALITVVSTFVVMAFAGWGTQWVINRRDKK